MNIVIVHDSLIWLTYAILIFAVLCIAALFRRLLLIVKFRPPGWRVVLLKGGFFILIMFGGASVMASSLLLKFNRIEITSETIKLSYAWPRKDVALSRSDVQDIRIITFANGRRLALEVVANDVYTSSTSKSSNVGDAFKEAILAVKR